MGSLVIRETSRGYAPHSSLINMITSQGLRQVLHIGSQSCAEGRSEAGTGQSGMYREQEDSHLE